MHNTKKLLRVKAKSAKSVENVAVRINLYMMVRINLRYVHEKKFLNIIYYDNVPAVPFSFTHVYTIGACLTPIRFMGAR